VRIHYHLQSAALHKSHIDVLSMLLRNEHTLTVLLMMHNILRICTLLYMPLCVHTSQVLARFRHELVILGQPAEAFGDAAASAVQGVGLTAAQRAATSK
jgi:hypothetical protein